MDAAVYNPKSHYTDKKSPMTDEDMERLQKDLDLGRWNFYGATYGPEPVRNVLWGAIKAAFGQIEGTRFYFPEDRNEPHSVLKTRANTMQGVPTLDELRWIE
jgi:hypothetical protein